VILLESLSRKGFKFGGIYVMVNRRFNVNLDTEIFKDLEENFLEIGDKINNGDISWRNNEYRIRQVISAIYYKIGMIDYQIAFEEIGKKQIFKRLKERLKYSAILEMKEKQYPKRNLALSRTAGIQQAISEGRIGNVSKSCCDVMTILNERLRIPDTVYHGTSQNVDERDLGKKGEDDFYHSRDGLVYFSFDRSKAGRYAEGTNGKILNRSFSENDIFAVVEKVDGGLPFEHQEALLAMLQKYNIRYLVSSSPASAEDIVDISNYADFVKTRDEKIENKLKKFKIQLPEILNYNEWLSKLELDNIDKDEI